jgi:cobalt-zinc-cadmium efflux system outer membrane protein
MINDRLQRIRLSLVSGTGALATLLCCHAVYADGPANPAVPPAIPNAPSTAPVTGNVITLPEAERVFRSQGFDLLLAQAAVTAAQADTRAAAAYSNPVLGATLGRTFKYDPSQCDGCSNIPWSVFLSDSGTMIDFLVGKRKLRMSVADAALEAAKMARVDAERTLIFSLRQQYLQTAQATSVLRFVLETRTSAQQTHDLISVRYKAGSVSEADVARAETALLEAEQAVDSARQALQTNKITLAFLLGYRGKLVDFDIDTSVIRFQIPTGLRGADRESLLNRAMAERPDLRVIRAQLNRAQGSISLAQRSRFPDIALSLQYSQEGSSANALQPPTVTAGISAPIPLLYQSQGEIARAQADLTTQQVQLSREQAVVSSDVDTALAAYLATKTRVERMESRLLDSSRRARDLVSVQYEKGAASLLELLDAQRTFIATNVEYFQTLNDYWTAVFQVEQAVGTELR